MVYKSKLTKLEFYVLYYIEYVVFLIRIFLICQGLLLGRAKDNTKEKKKVKFRAVAVAAAKTGQDDCG